MHPETIVVAAALALAWGLGHRQPRPGSGERASVGRAMLFAAGLVAGLAAVNGPVHELAESRYFSAHMLQHLLLTLVVPPLMLAGLPAWVGDRAVAVALRGPRAVAAACVLTRPVPALAIYTATLVVWHLPEPYGAALESEAWHVVEHALLLVSAFLAWWPVLGPSRRVPPLPYAGQILYLFAFGMPMTVVAAMITAADTPLYAFYAAAARAHAFDALADQRIGGVLMWVPAGIVPLVAFTIVFFRWAAAESDDAVEGMNYQE